MWASRAILEDFCLELSGHEKLGIVGESGIGKSTVLRLLLRFWNPKSGHIRVNGIPLERVPLEELRRRVAVLEQARWGPGCPAVSGSGWALPG